MAGLEDLSLAAWRYRRAFTDQGGPIAQITHGTVEWRDTQGGRVQGVQALAILGGVAGASTVSENRVYSSAEGTGTARYRFLAEQIAISEALERWAHRVVQADRNAAQAIGFQIDRTTSGMAAFPGLMHSGARARAFREAIERWALQRWWEAGLPMRVGSHEAELVTPWHPSVRVIVAWGQSPLSGLHAYGFAAGRALDAARERAWIECSRNERALDLWVERGRPSVTTTQERRLLYFGAEAGHAQFRARLEIQVSDDAVDTRPPLLVDCELRGPWSHYATVWRCLFEPESGRYLSDAEDYFFF